MNKNIIFKGFTLVELIIVVTLLILLTSISFIGFQGYTKGSRDTNRITTMTNIDSALNLYFSKTQKYPDPKDKITIQSSGSVIGYQGKFGSDVSRIVGIDTKPEDPIDKKEYLYYINQYSNKYELLGYLEGPLQASYLGIENTYADMSSRTVKVLGNKLGIILDSFKDSIMGSTFDVKNINSTYNIYFSDNDYINSNSGNLIFSNILNRRNDFLTDKNILKLDDYLVGYWDMETTILSGSQVLLKDLSKYSNNGICYNNSSIVNCNSGNGPLFTTKGILFDGIDDFISINNNSSFNFSSGFTLNTTFSLSKINSSLYGILGKGNPDTPTSNSGFVFMYDNRFPVSFYQYLAFGNSQGGYAGGGNNFAGSAYDYKLIEGTFYNFTIVINNNIGTFYINGNKIGESKNFNNINLNSNSNLYLGKVSLYADTFFNGKISSTSLYNRPLSSSEVETLYQTQINKK